jgi:hypothetical protein
MGNLGKDRNFNGHGQRCWQFIATALGVSRQQPVIANYPLSALPCVRNRYSWITASNLLTCIRIGGSGLGSLHADDVVVRQLQGLSEVGRLGI